MSDDSRPYQAHADVTEALQRSQQVAACINDAHTALASMRDDGHKSTHLMAAERAAAVAADTCLVEATRLKLLLKHIQMLRDEMGGGAA